MLKKSKILARRTSSSRNVKPILEDFDSDTINKLNQLNRLDRKKKQIVKKGIGLTNVTDLIVPKNRQKTINLTDMKDIKPLTNTQQEVFDAWKDNWATAYVLHGSAGTGKSMVSTALALKEVLRKDSEYDKVIIIRAINSIRDLGALPGSLEERTLLWTIPIVDICSDLFGFKGAYDKLVEQGKIEFMTTSVLRGLSFHRAIVILEEFQCLNWSEINTVMGRIGSGTKIFINGDFLQNDLVVKKNDVSGYDDFMAVAKNIPEIKMFKFTPEDCVRSGFARSWLKSCESLGII